MATNDPIRAALSAATFLFAVIAPGACAITPMPVLTDFSEIKAEVRVPYDAWFGPSLEESQPAADPVGAEHCASLGKEAVFVSARSEATSYVVSGAIEYEDQGVHIFLYRCEDDESLVGNPP